MQPKLSICFEDALTRAIAATMGYQEQLTGKTPQGVHIERGLPKHLKSESGGRVLPQHLEKHLKILSDSQRVIPSQGCQGEPLTVFSTGAQNEWNRSIVKLTAASMMGQLDRIPLAKSRKIALCFFGGGIVTIIGLIVAILLLVNPPAFLLIGGAILSGGLLLGGGISALVRHVQIKKGDKLLNEVYKKLSLILEANDITTYLPRKVIRDEGSPQQREEMVYDLCKVRMAAFQAKPKENVCCVDVWQKSD